MENIGKKVTVYTKTTLGKTVNYVKMGHGQVGEWPSGSKARPMPTIYIFLLFSVKQITNMKKELPIL